MGHLPVSDAPDAGRDDPPKLGPPDIGFAAPVMCLHCERRLAVPLTGEAGVHVMPVFCSEPCAVTFALDHVANSLYNQCDFCGGWTDEQGDCVACNAVVSILDTEGIDEILADEAARKAVQYDA